MQDLQLVAFVVLVLSVILRLLERAGRPAHERSLVALVTIGAMTGALAAVAVLTQTGDLVPDTIETTASPLFILTATVVLLYFVWKPRPEA